MTIINLSNPYAIILAVMFTVLLIVLGKEFKKSALPAINLGIFLFFIVMHLFQSFAVGDEASKVVLTKCITVDALMVFLSYIAYLWVDDIEAKEKNKKSIDNSLDWFWKKV